MDVEKELKRKKIISSLFFYSTDAGIRGLHGSMKPLAKSAMYASRDILKLWKNRDKSWAKMYEQIIIDNYFNNPDKPWAKVVNRICAHR